MKQVVFICVGLLLFSCQPKTESIGTDLIKNPVMEADQTNLPEISFKEERIDFGTIKEGDVVSRVFEFTNTGSSALLIEDVSGSCGCTVPKNWPKNPIQPGESGKIEVSFNSQGKPGQQVKQITVSANTNPAITTVALAGFVEKATSN